MSNFAKNKEKARKSEFKRVGSADEKKKHRLDNFISIRKNKRAENLQKRRQLITNHDMADMMPSQEEDVSQQLQALPQMAAFAKSDDAEKQLEGTTALRKILSIETNPPIDEVIMLDVVPTLVTYLKTPSNTQLQFEAAWALTNIASGNSKQTLYLLQKGAVPAFVQLLGCANSSEVCDQAVWALGNIAGDSTRCRDYVLQFGVFPRLLELTQPSASSSLSVQRNATWTISNLCRGSPPPSWEVVSPALPHLARLIKTTAEEDLQIIIDACWGISYLSDGDDNNIAAVLQTGCVERVVQLLHHILPAVQTPALRVIGNIVTGSNEQTQVVLDANALPALKNLLHSTKSGIRKEVCWTISNMTAGTVDQLTTVLKSGIIPDLLLQLSIAEFEIKKEAAWAIANATSSGNIEQISYLVSLGCIAPMCALLQIVDSRITIVALEAIENILKKGAQYFNDPMDNPFIEEISKANGINLIEDLQQHANEEIYKKCEQIIENYFDCGDMDAEDNISEDCTSFQVTNQNNTDDFKF